MSDVELEPTFKEFKKMARLTGLPIERTRSNYESLLAFTRSKGADGTGGEDWARRALECIPERYLEEHMRRLATVDDVLMPPCDGCGRQARHSRRCGGCRAARYCSRECQRAHWPLHRESCRRGAQ